MPVTPTVFCAVSAVIAVMPWTPRARERLQVGLDAGAAAGVRAGDRQHGGHGTRGHVPRVGGAGTVPRPSWTPPSSSTSEPPPPAIATSSASARSSPRSTGPRITRSCPTRSPTTAPSRPQTTSPPCAPPTSAAAACRGSSTCRRARRPRRPRCCAGGFAVEARLALMTCGPGDVAAIEPPDGVELVLPDTDEQLRDGTAVANAAFGEPGVPRPLRCARLRGRIVAGAIAVLARDVAGGRAIGWGECIAPATARPSSPGSRVDEAQRRRGIAGAITARLAREAFARGVETAFLTPGRRRRRPRLRARRVRDALADAAPARPELSGRRAGGTRGGGPQPPRPSGAVERQLEVRRASRPSRRPAWRPRRARRASGCSRAGR